MPTGLPPPAPSGSPCPQCLRQETAFPSWSPHQLSVAACVRPRNSSSQGTHPWGPSTPQPVPGTLGTCTDKRGNGLSPAVPDPAEPHACPVVSHQAAMGPVCLCTPISWVMSLCRAPAALRDQDGANTLSGGPGMACASHAAWVATVAVGDSAGSRDVQDVVPCPLSHPREQIPQELGKH